MAYINKKDFSIIAGSNIDGYLDDYFECDDMIAPVIQELNRKGYTTEYCCGGHPYEDHSELIVLETRVDPYKIVKGTEYVEDQGNGKYRIVYNTRNGACIYIQFEHGKVPETIPDYAFLDDDGLFIEFDYEGGEDYNCMAIMLKYNRMLYQWAKGLKKIA